MKKKKQARTLKARQRARRDPLPPSLSEYTERNCNAIREAVGYTTDYFGPSAHLFSYVHPTWNPRAQSEWGEAMGQLHTYLAKYRNKRKEFIRRYLNNLLTL